MLDNSQSIAITTSFVRQYIHVHTCTYLYKLILLIHEKLFFRLRGSGLADSSSTGDVRLRLAAFLWLHHNHHHQRSPRLACHLLARDGPYHCQP